MLCDNRNIDSCRSRNLIPPIFAADKIKAPSSKKPFLLSSGSNAIAIRIKELDQCCCADRPCISIVKEYCESR